MLFINVSGVVEDSNNIFIVFQVFFTLMGETKRVILIVLILAVISSVCVDGQTVPTTDCNAFFAGKSDIEVYDNNNLKVSVRNEDCSDVNTGFVVRYFYSNEYLGEFDQRISALSNAVFEFNDLVPGTYSFRLYFYTWEDEALMDSIDGINVAWCGDGICGNAIEDQDDETCWTCEADCGCPDYEKCNRWIEECRGFCGNDIIEYNETCQNCPLDAGCAEGYFCGNTDVFNDTCIQRCGNGICNKDKGEDCWTCEEDCECGPYLDCNVNDATIYDYVENKDIPLDFAAQCLRVGTEENCGFAGDTCESGEFCQHSQCVECAVDGDCATFKIVHETGEFVCVDYNSAIVERIYERNYKCDWGKCIGERELQSEKINCKGKGCQNGVCGCEPDYEFCFEAWECRKVNTLGIGRPCKCGFECNSNFCYEEKCALKLIGKEAEKYLEKYGDEEVEYTKTYEVGIIVFEEPGKNPIIEWVINNRMIFIWILIVIIIIGLIFIVVENYFEWHKK